MDSKAGSEGLVELVNAVRAEEQKRYHRLVRALCFELNGQPVEVADVVPTTTVLQWLRARGLSGTKEGCAEGDCGACSIVLLDAGPEGPAWRAVNACLVFLPSLDGRRVLTVEGVAQADGTLHSVQRALVEHSGSQCGYCTPGFVMSMFEACYRDDLDASWKIDDQLCGNLCRCTGYRSIREATVTVAGSSPKDRFSRSLPMHSGLPALRYDAAAASYERPVTWEELFDAMDRRPEHRFICGGTDLGLNVTKAHEHFEALIALEGFEPIRKIESSAETYRIGAAVTLAEIERELDAELPTLTRMLRYFASRQIKNRATIGGNLCNASPIGDLAPVLMALGASLILRSRSGERRIAIEEFFIGYRKTALRAGELLTHIDIPRPAAGLRLGAYKVSKRRELDISAVCAGFAVDVVDGVVVLARLAFGGLSATTQRASAAEGALAGEPWNEASVRAAMLALASDFTPVGDHRASQWYRSTLARNLLLGFFHETLTFRNRALADRPSSTLSTKDIP